MRTAILAALVAAVLLILPTAAASASTTYTVNSTADPGDGTCNAAECTLREALNSFPDTVAFNIPGTNPHTISVSSALPPITQPVLIDGTSQPGYAGTPVVEVTTAAFAPDGFLIYAGGVTIRGLSVTEFDTANIHILTTSLPQVAVTGNYIGVRPDGVTDASHSHGIFIEDATDVLIGGTSPQDSNLIAGNSTGILSVLEQPVDTSNVTILGNRIGVDALGNPLPNTYGIRINRLGVTTIGGTSPGAGNVIKNNAQRGLDVLYNSSISILGNQISNNGSGIQILAETAEIGDGTTAGANTVSNNGGNGITAEYGTISIQGNVLANNGRNGVEVRDDLTHALIARNSIHDSGYLGIDLLSRFASSGVVTPNDPLDADDGPNDLQNFPQIDVATVAASPISASGELHSSPNHSYAIDLYASPACDPTGNGEGQRWIGSTTASTNASGDATFAFSGGTYGVGDNYLTATTTDSGGNTSEFSQCAMVQNAAVGGNVTLTTSPATTHPPYAVALAAILPALAATAWLARRRIMRR